MNRARSPFPLVTALVAVGLVLAYAVELAAGGEGFCQAHGLIPARFMSSGDLGPVFTHTLLHDPEAPFAHLGGNVLVLLLAGMVVEPELGRARFLVLYVVSGLVGCLLHVAVDPTSSVALVGASGSIAGVLAVMGAIRPRLIGFAVGFLLVNIYSALSGTGGAVSFGTHLGGAFAGVLFVVFSRVLGADVRRTVAA